ncbi:unnamed protein product [Ectocarpus sp. 6 AP-2014]
MRDQPSPRFARQPKITATCARNKKDACDPWNNNRETSCRLYGGAVSIAPLLSEPLLDLPLRPRKPQPAGSTAPPSLAGVVDEHPEGVGIAGEEAVPAVANTCCSCCHFLSLSQA